MLSINLLLLNILILILSCFLILVLPTYKIRLIKQIALLSSLIVFIVSLLLWILFNNEENKFIYVLHLPWLSKFNIFYSLGLDGISIFFIILTTFLTPLCILISWYSIKYKIKEFLLMLLITEFLLINVF